jgi:hypothetical protein
MRRRVFQASILALLLSPLACSLLVDLTGLSGDGAVDASVDASLDTALDHVAEAQTETSVDANLDAGSDVTCSNPDMGNALTIPTQGFLQAFFTSGPIVTGDYLLTNARFLCSGCNGVQGVIVGGVHVTASGSAVAIERHVDFSYGTVQIRHTDRWSGTFDQINQKIAVTEDCPEAGATASWNAYVAVAADGGSLGQLELSFVDVMGANTLDASTPVPIALYFTKK